jgi:hypothetical protein
MKLGIEHGSEGIDKDVDTFIGRIIARGCPRKVERERRG